MKQKKPGPKSDAAIMAAAERASKSRDRILVSLTNVLERSDAKVTAGEDIPFSWIGFLGKLLQSERAAAMWDNADDGADEEGAPR